MIPVARPYLPKPGTLQRYIDRIYDSQWVTNNGPLVQELTTRLRDYLGVDNLLLVSNGTLALQIAYRAVGITPPSSVNTSLEAITTPFTFVATASSLEWERVRPRFCDIDPQTWCLDPQLIESLITPHTRAIVPVHVFGNACDVETINEIACRRNLKVIYDASHAFGVAYKGQSILNWGDAATLSFHGTKLFHTGEGGAIVFRQKSDLEKAKKMINFGITGPETIESLGINGKMSELQAAMGLAVLDEIEENLHARREIGNFYDENLPGSLQRQSWNDNASQNYAYMPIVMESEGMVLRTVKNLEKSGFGARRYFYPSLNNVDCYKKNIKKSNSEIISSKILCLPMHSGLTKRNLEKIINVVELSING